MTLAESADLFDCQKCGATVYPWYLRCEGCGDTSPSKPRTWNCPECGQDYDTEDAARLCCSMFYCRDCDFEVADLRDPCNCPRCPVCNQQMPADCIADCAH